MVFFSVPVFYLCGPEFIHNQATSYHDWFVWFSSVSFGHYRESTLKLIWLLSFYIPCNSLLAERALSWCCMVKAVTKSHETRTCCPHFAVLLHRISFGYFPILYLNSCCLKYFFNKNIVLKYNGCVAECDVQYSLGSFSKCVSWEFFIWRLCMTYSHLIPMQNGLQNHWYLVQDWNLVLQNSSWI